MDKRYKHFQQGVCTGIHWLLVIAKMNYGYGDEWVAKAKQKERVISFEQVKYPDDPERPNDTDCGAYVMNFFYRVYK